MKLGVLGMTPRAFPNGRSRPYGPTSSPVVHLLSLTLHADSTPNYVYKITDSTEDILFIAISTIPSLSWMELPKSLGGSPSNQGSWQELCVWAQEANGTEDGWGSGWNKLGGKPQALRHPVMLSPL